MSAHREKWVEVEVVVELLQELDGIGVKLPVQWDAYKQRIYAKLRVRGEYELADALRVNGDGITLRWIRLELRQSPGGSCSWVITQALAQKAKEAQDQ